MAKFPRAVIKELKVHLNDSDMQAQFEQLVTVDKRIDTVAAEKSASASVFNAQLKDLRKERTDLLNTISTKAATYPFKCEERINEQRGEIETYRLDTGKIIEELTRPMTAEERQLSLDDSEPLDGDDEGPEDEGESNPRNFIPDEPGRLADDEEEGDEDSEGLGDEDDSEE